MGGGVRFASWHHRHRICEQQIGSRGLVKPVWETGAEGDQKALIPFQLELEEMRGNDFFEIEKIRMAHRQWLQPWEATLPPEAGKSGVTLQGYLQQCRRQMRAGTMLPMKMVLDGVIVGQITLSGINRGALQSGSIGYWISQDYAGRGVTTVALAMLIDYALTELALNRIEVPIRPHNQSSLRVVEKLGLETEGMRRSYIHINGQWADHLIFTAIAGRVPEGGYVAKLENSRSDAQG